MSDSEMLRGMNSDHIVVSLLDQKLLAIEEEIGEVNALTFIGPLIGSSDVLVRKAIENISGRKSGLLVILETNGGYIETVERIVNVLRHHYRRVEFIVPDHAMSAGTVLALSGDVIHMDYFSTLGPIDPQVRRPGASEMIPIQGYLAQYERLLKKAERGDLTTAELNILVTRFDQAEIYKFEQTVELSVTLLKKWLVKYKFKDWVKTSTTGKKVTPSMKKKRAEEIARALNDTAKWHTHGRGITLDILQRDLNLRIDDFEKNKKLSAAIKSYTTLLSDYMTRTGQAGVVHVKGLYFPG